MSELVDIVSVMPETNFRATLMCAAVGVSLSSNSCHPGLPGSSAELDLPLICRTWQPTLLGTVASTPHFCFVPRSDVSCPYENNPEIWSGNGMVQNRSPGAVNISCVCRPGHTILLEKLQLQGWSPWGKPAGLPTNISGTGDVTTLAKLHLTS